MELGRQCGHFETYSSLSFLEAFDGQVIDGKVNRNSLSYSPESRVKLTAVVACHRVNSGNVPLLFSLATRGRSRNTKKKEKKEEPGCLIQFDIRRKVCTVTRAVK